jgi:hypothetical protein
MKLTKTGLALAAGIAGGIVILGAVGGGTAYMLTSHSPPTTTVIYQTASPSKTAAPAKTDPPKTPAPPAPTTAAPPAPTTAAPAVAPTIASPAPVQVAPTIVVNVGSLPDYNYVPIEYGVPGYVTSNQAVVQEFYNDLNAQDFTDAWNLGGNNLNGDSGYDAWVSGYTTTTVPGGISLSTWSYYPDSDAVEVTITADQLDGSINTYQGYYAVEGGVIVGAHIVQTG